MLNRSDFITDGSLFYNSVQFVFNFVGILEIIIFTARINSSRPVRCHSNVSVRTPQITSTPVA